MYGFGPPRRSKGSDKVHLVALAGEYDRRPANAMHRHAGLLWARYSKSRVENLCSAANEKPISAAFWSRVNVFTAIDGRKPRGGPTYA